MALNKLIRSIILIVSLFTIHNLRAGNNFESISYVLDEQNSFTKENILSQAFTNSEKSTLNFGFYRGTVWIKIKLDRINKSSLLELKNSNLDIIHFYNCSQNELQLMSKTGDHFPFDNRSIDHRFFDFPLNGNAEIILQIENFGDQLFIPIALKTQGAMAKSEYYEQLIFGIYYGLCLFAFFLNIFIYVKIRERSNLYYSLYIVGIVFLQLALDGHGFQYLWSDNVFFAKHAPPLLASISIFFLILFAQSFLNIKSLLPVSNKIFTSIAYLVGLNIVLSLFAYTYPIAVLVINVLTLLLNIMILPVAFYAYRKKFKPAKFFLIAFVVLIISVFVFVLRNFGIIESNIFTDYCLQIGSTVEVVLLSFAIVDKFNSYKEEALTHLKEINQLQTEQTERLEMEVALRTERITDQKNQIEEKNKEIIDSINYAKRIQNALIPSKEFVEKTLPNSFVLWEPKDIVSGDFYWVSEVTTTKESGENASLTLFSVGDCTGHGVPGAIISVLGLKILNLSLGNKEINTTGDALKFLNNEFFTTFHHEDGEGIADGMDIAFCALDRSRMELYYSGARNGIYIIRDKELIELKGDKVSIGSTKNHSFSEQIFSLQPNDCIYLYSDGFADQFGGPKNKKFKYQPLKNALISYSHLEMKDQLTHLKELFYDWKGAAEQTDDVCIVGLQV